MTRPCCDRYICRKDILYEQKVIFCRIIWRDVIATYYNMSQIGTFSDKQPFVAKCDATLLRQICLSQKVYCATGGVLKRPAKGILLCWLGALLFFIATKVFCRFLRILYFFADFVLYPSVLLDNISLGLQLAHLSLPFRLPFLRFW